MTSSNRPPRRGDDEVVVLDDGGGSDDLARALEDAARAVEAIEEKHRHVPAHAAPPEPAGVAGTWGGTAPPATNATPGGPADAPVPAGDDRLVADLQSRLMAERTRSETAEEEAGKAREVLLRTVADFENFKRRTEREKADAFRNGLADVLRDLLGALDNLERAIAHAGDGSGAEFKAGVEMTARQFLDVLKRQGVQPVEADGAPFDPNVHEAVMREERADVPPGTVSGVFQKGYLLNDRLLRPAMVKVSAAPQSLQAPQPATRPAGGGEPPPPADVPPGEGG